MKTQTSRQKQAIETKHKLFSCAISLFAQNTYENVTVQDICTKADVSVGAFYHHFKSKGDILDEGYRLFDESSLTAWNEGHPDQPLNQIRFLIQAQAGSMSGWGAPAALQYFKNQLTEGEKYILNPDRFFYRTLKQSVEQAVSQKVLSGNPYAIAEDILGATRGTIYDWCLHEGSYDLMERSLRILHMVLDYYKRQGHIETEREGIQ